MTPPTELGSAIVATPLLADGIFSPIQIVLFIVFLISSLAIFGALKDQYNTGTAFLIAGGLYLFMVIWSVLILQFQFI